ncbi:DNA sulfur modification protein DndE [Waterburya agarophytonicola K14]|uniref:DNA sulfur modification protein DndE n=1 Tax=Waterburya agarophytonicola KI4 TaxID=2874699 RepID=A0A964FH97_9CYAN|nr:DNA sulfur modification protein DndE [Waterburya agarophytonicola]MCC0179785.1 DNA sulfur modification protein DndE [Waterburya agarophytonicola KI4]
MDNPIERIRISQTAEDQLVQLKRNTKIKQWNILCRWAIARSLAESSTPSPVTIKTDSKVEILWSVFGGEIADILLIALKQRCYQDGLGTDSETLKQQFTLHLHRGITYLAGDAKIQQIEDLVRKVTTIKSL